jgi:hypothetical protein
MKGEYGEIGFPASPTFVSVGVFEVRRYHLANGIKEWEKRCPGCKSWKPEGEFWSDRKRKTRTYCKLCTKIGVGPLE